VKTPLSNSIETGTFFLLEKGTLPDSVPPAPDVENWGQKGRGSGARLVPVGAACVV
jgi:hypothetical protein